MNGDSKQPRPIGRRLATQSPWLLIALLIHVVGVAIASIRCFAHAAASDDSVRTEISIAASPTPPEQIKPPEIVDTATARSRSRADGQGGVKVDVMQIKRA